MKLIPTLAVAAAASLTVLSSGFAAECGARPPRLAIPDGKTASDDQMKATQAKLTPYATAMSKYLHCLSEEIQAGTAEYKSVTDEWTKQAQAFKDTPAK